MRLKIRNLETLLTTGSSNPLVLKKKKLIQDTIDKVANGTVKEVISGFC
jgi:hypothetical protein